MVQTRRIKSVESAESLKPWYELEINNGEPEITADKDGGQGETVTGTANVPDFVDLPAPAQATMPNDTVFAVTESGEFIAYKPGDDLASNGITLRAHLAWYDADADEFTVLEFVDPTQS